MKMGLQNNGGSWWREAGVEVTREEMNHEGTHHLWQIVIRLWKYSFWIRWEREKLTRLSQ